MRRRRVLAAASGVGAALLAGCSGGGGGSDDGGGGYGGGGDDGGGGYGGGGGGGSGTFELLVSDQPAAIGDFESLDVTLSSARIFRADEGEDITSAAVTPDETETETPEPTTAETEAGTAEGREGFVELDLNDVTVDLTTVVGDKAVSVLEGELEEGRYSGIELRVAGTEGVVGGETVAVMVPSNRLRIVRPFETAADEELSFVFDINVVKRGPNGYNLLPVIGKSGVVGEDVEVDEVDGDGDETGTETTTADGDETGTETTTADGEETETAEPTAEPTAETATTDGGSEAGGQADDSGY